MPTVQLDISKGVYKNVDGLEVRDGALERIDCFLDAAGGTTSRPTLKTTTGPYANRVNGIHYWGTKDLLVVAPPASIALGNLNFYRGGVLQYQAAMPEALPLTSKVIFAAAASLAGVNRIYFAANSAIYYVDESSLTTVVKVTDSDAPTNVTHVSYLDGYVIATNGGLTFYFSQLGDGSAWNAADYARAVGAPDPILAHHVADRRIYFFGRDSIEVWENDGSTPFSRVTGGFIEVGLGAIYSVVRVDAALYFLTKDRRFARISGTQAEYLSSPYDKVFQELASISDCRASYVSHSGHRFIYLTFPEANRTFVYNLNNESWSEYGIWDVNSGRYNLFPVIASDFDESSNQTAVGTLDRGWCALSSSQYSDSALVDSSVTTPRFLLRTSNITHGSLRNKRSDELRFVAKSGKVDIGREPKVFLRWRNNDGDVWSNYHLISLGNLGVRRPVKRLRRAGMYIMRQYEVTISDPVPGIIAEVEEDISTLR